MMYLSRGGVIRLKRGAQARVSRCGKSYVLGPTLAGIWERGRRMPQTVPAGQERAVRRLAESGLVVITDEDGDLGTYRLVTSCMVCPSYKVHLGLPLHGRGRRVWNWITQAGLRLTVGELIRLEELEVEPTAGLLGEEGRQALTETIYTRTTIFDGILETLMEHSPARDTTVATILQLLRGHRLLLV